MPETRPPVDVTPWRILSLAAAALAVLATACSTGGPAPAASGPVGAVVPSVEDRLADAPVWVTQGCRAHWRDAGERRRIVCGVGSAPPNRNRVRARDTAITRARSEIARSLQVTIEDMVRLADRGDGDSELETIVHQLSTASLRGCQVESVWRAESGETHALVSLDVDRVATSVRSAPTLPPAVRESIAKRAEDAFAELDAAFDEEEGGGSAE